MQLPNDTSCHNYGERLSDLIYRPTESTSKFHNIMRVHHRHIYSILYVFHPESICHDKSIFNKVIKYYSSSKLRPFNIKYEGDEISCEYLDEGHSFTQLREKIICDIPKIDEYIKLYAKDKVINDKYNDYKINSAINNSAIYNNTGISDIIILNSVLDNLISERNNIIQPNGIKYNEIETIRYIDIDDAINGESFVPYDENYISSYENCSLINDDRVSFVESYDPKEDSMTMFHRMTFEREHNIVDYNNDNNDNNDDKSTITIDNVSMLSDTYEYSQFCNILNACVTAAELYQY
jgi:hypothetical protein